MSDFVKQVSYTFGYLIFGLGFLAAVIAFGGGAFTRMGGGFIAGGTAGIVILISSLASSLVFFAIGAHIENQQMQIKLIRRVLLQFGDSSEMASTFANGDTSKSPTRSEDDRYAAAAAAASGKPSAPSRAEWTCSKCGEKNKALAMTCASCGAYK